MDDGNVGGEDMPPGMLASLDKHQRAGYDGARRVWSETGALGEPLPSICGTVIGRGKHKGETCRRPAGYMTSHLGYGECNTHGGRWRAGRAKGSWIMGHEFARELNCSPWEGLLRAVRIAAGKVAYVQWVLSHASDDLQLEGRRPAELEAGSGIFVHPDTGEALGSGALRDLNWWVEKEELWVDRLAKYSKAAIDAGVAERLVQQAELEAQSIARVLNGTLAAMEDWLSDEQVSQAREVMRRELLQLEQEQRGGIVEGQVV